MVRANLCCHQNRNAFHNRRTVEGEGDDAMNRNTGRKVVAGPGILVPESPCGVDGSGTLPEFVQLIDRAVVANAVSLAAILDLEFGFADLQKVVMLASRRYRRRHFAQQHKSVSAMRVNYSIQVRH